uniref:Long-chain-fatty-acid--CoA ligase n=1 Tax=Saccoglossus kowalevskii TaxID=10224 RepID=A0ABM0M1X8_SACKO|nr:PREDICTED: long-chain fatty acid transport protein 1-like [Saccoglossus kowalevskii]
MEGNSLMPLRISNRNSKNRYDYTASGITETTRYLLFILIPILQKCSPLPPPVIANRCFTDRLFYIYTSGTTGLPKAAIITHARFVYMAYGMNRCFWMNSDDIIYCPLPLYHSAGGIVGIGQTIVSGITVVIRKKFSASQFWDDCITYNCTIIQYIGEICRYLKVQPVKAVEKQHKVRMAVGNGLRPQIWEEFVTRFNIPKIAEFYGSTEGNANIVNTNNKPGAVGFNSRIAPWAYPIKLVRVNEDTGEVIRDPRTGLCIICEPGVEGRCGMAAVVDKHHTLDLVALANNLKKQLPSYARPLFIRLVESVDTTGTFKIKKTELRKESFNPNVVKDKLYFSNSKTGEYQLINAQVYSDICNGKVRL